MGERAQILIGAISSSITALFIQPFDVVKTAYLTGKDSNLLSEAITFVYRRYGLFGYWRGIKPGVTRALFSGGVGFPILETMRSITPEGFSWNMISSAVTRAIVICLVSPLTVLKVRMEAPQSTSYKSLASGCLHIYNEVGIKGYYVGIGPHLIRDIPFSAFAYGFYQYYFDSLIFLTHGDKRNVVNFAAAACGSCTATIMTQPFDVIKTRLQFAQIDKHHYHNYGGIRDGIKSIWTHEGIKGFTRGLSVRTTEKTISYAIVWGIYEKLKELIRNWS